VQDFHTSFDIEQSPFVIRRHPTGRYLLMSRAYSLCLVDEVVGLKMKLESGLSSTVEVMFLASEDSRC